MSWDNPTDYELGICDAQGRVYPESRQCHLCTNIGMDGNPNNESAACQRCTRNDSRPHVWDCWTIKDRFEIDGPDEPPEFFTTEEER
jgi:hypothetical protein